MAHLMDVQRRHELAAELTAAVRVHSGRSRHSALERLHRHATVALEMCLELELGAAAAVRVQDVYHAAALMPEEAAAGGAALAAVGEAGVDAMDMDQDRCVAVAVPEATAM
jgi:hypothetical protein